MDLSVPTFLWPLLCTSVTQLAMTKKFCITQLSLTKKFCDRGCKTIRNHMVAKKLKVLRKFH